MVCLNGVCFFILYGFRPLACTSSEFVLHCILQTFQRNLWTGDRPLLGPLPSQVNTERYGGGGLQGMGLFASSVLSLPSQDVQKIMSPGFVLSSMLPLHLLGSPSDSYCLTCPESQPGCSAYVYLYNTVRWRQRGHVYVPRVVYEPATFLFEW